TPSGGRIRRLKCDWEGPLTIDAECLRIDATDYRKWIRRCEQDRGFRHPISIDLIELSIYLLNRGNIADTRNHRLRAIDRSHARHGALAGKDDFEMGYRARIDRNGA